MAEDIFSEPLPDIKDGETLTLEKMAARLDAIEASNRETVDKLVKANSELWAALHPVEPASVPEPEPQKEESSEFEDTVRKAFGVI